MSMIKSMLNRVEHEKIITIAPGEAIPKCQNMSGKTVAFTSCQLKTLLTIKNIVVSFCGFECRTNFVSWPR